MPKRQRRTADEVENTTKRFKVETTKQRKGALKANHPILANLPMSKTLAQLMPGVDTTPAAILSPEQEKINIRKARNAAIASEKKYQFDQNLKKAKERGFDNYQDAYAIIMRVMSEQMVFAEMVQAMLASQFPRAYPQTFGELVGSLASPVTGLASVAKKVGVSVKDKVIKGPEANQRVIQGEIDVSIDAKGVVSSRFTIHGQEVKEQSCLNDLNEIVMDYIQREGYDIDITNPKEPKVLYPATHPTSAGQVISSQDFKDLFKDNNKDLKEYVASAMENRSSFRP